MPSLKNCVSYIFFLALVIQRLQAQHLATEQLAVTKLLKTDFKRSTVNSTTVSEKLPSQTSSGLYINFSNFTLHDNVPETFSAKLLPPAVDNSKIIYAPAAPLMEDLFDITGSENKTDVSDTQLYSLKLEMSSQAVSDKRTQTSNPLMSEGAIITTVNPIERSSLELHEIASFGEKNTESSILEDTNNTVLNDGATKSNSTQKMLFNSNQTYFFTNMKENTTLSVTTFVNSKSVATPDNINHSGDNFFSDMSREIKWVQKIDIFPNDAVLSANQSCLVSVPDSLSNKGLIKFLVLTNDSARYNLPKLFETRLRHALNERNCNSILMMSFSNSNPFSFSWTNASMNSTVCEHSTLDKISEKIFNGTNISAQFSEAFLPYFKIQSVDINRLGICIKEPEGPDLIKIIILVVFGLAATPFFVIVLFKLLHVCKCINSYEVKPKSVLNARPPFILHAEDISLPYQIRRLSEQKMHDAKFAMKHHTYA